MKKRILSVLLCLCMVMACLPTTALAAGTGITVTNVTYYNSGALHTISGSFYWGSASAKTRLVLMKEQLRSTVSGYDTYGDFTDNGYYFNKNFYHFEDVLAYDQDLDGGTAGVFGIRAKTEECSVNIGSNNNFTFTFEESDIPLSTNAIYYVYLWTYYNSRYYPDHLICAIQVQDGAVRYASATGSGVAFTTGAERNAYDSSGFANVVSASEYKVTVIPGAYMTKVDGSGELSQNGLTTAMTPVVYTANTGYYFPGDYSVDTVNGIMVRRDSQSQITVYGTPSANAEITLTAPTAITTYTVTRSETTNGSFEVNKTNAAAGETITITATPNSGYEVDTVAVKDANDTSVDVTKTEDTYTFTMPAKNVTVTVTFKPTTYTITYNLNGGTNAVTNPATYTVETDDITLASPTRSGYTFGGWFNNSGLTGSAVTTIARGSTGNKTFWAKWTENQVYTYAYDASRYPAFPDSVGAEITASSFGKPLKSDSNRYASSQGTWTLTKVGYYADKSSFSPAPTSYLDDVVNAVASKYSLNEDGKNGLAIHKLTDAGGTHVAYGVLIAVDETNGYALFVGDLWNSSGAGYLLSKNAVSVNSVTFNAQQTAQSKYSISLSPATVTFTEAQTGYTVPAAQTITVTNTGNDATGNLTVALSNADSFTLSTPTISSITTTNDTARFTVQPKSGLAAGTYSATVTVSGNKVMPVTATVSFTVNATPAPSTGGSYTPPTYKVESEVSKSTDGTVSSDHSTAKAGDKVTITVTPDPYYKVDGVVIKDQNGKKIAVTDNKDGTFTFQMPSSKVTVEPIFSWDNPFVDVTEDAYYAPAVEWALKNDVTNGSGDGSTFSPDAVCTRAQIVTFLWRVAGSPAPVSSENPFTDVTADSYYYDAVLWAVEQGITGGTGSGKFSPNATCTRGQSVTLLYRADGAPAVSGNVSFSDVAAGSYCAPAVEWAEQNGITGGIGGGLFGAANGCTRAQIVTFLYRYLEN